jgi:hypothetical protein
MTMRSKHRDISAKFTATFPAATIQKWEAMIANWLADKKKPNPYKEPVSCQFVIPSFKDQLLTHFISNYCS